MNAKQRRKDCRSRLKNRKFNTGQEVRIKHELKDHFDTYKIYKIMGVAWSRNEKSVVYYLEKDLKIDERNLVLNTKEDRRKII